MFYLHKTAPPVMLNFLLKFVSEFWSLLRKQLCCIGCFIKETLSFLAGNTFFELNPRQHCQKRNEITVLYFKDFMEHRQVQSIRVLLKLSNLKYKNERILWNTVGLDLSECSWSCRTGSIIIKGFDGTPPSWIYPSVPEAV